MKNEIILSNGRTAVIKSVNLFDKVRTAFDDGMANIKKIKTNADQVKAAQKEFTKVVNEVKKEEVVEEPVQKEVTLAEPVFEKPVAPVVEPTIERKPVVEQKPAFETVPTAEAIDRVYQKDMRIGVESYNKLYDKLDPLEKLKQDFNACEEGTKQHTVLRLGIKMVEKYDTQLAQNDMKHVELEKKLKELQMEIEKNKTEKVEIEKAKREDANKVSNAAKEAKLIDDLDKSTKEREIKREQEEAQRKAQKEAEDRATASKRSEILSRIPLDLQEEAAKKPVVVVNKEKNAFDSIRKQEETFDFTKGRAA